MRNNDGNARGFREAMMHTLSVKNFAKFQHYKDRAPPWIKLYNEVLDDYEFGQLPDASKAHLIAIWLLASRYDNKIPADAEWITRRINATSPVDISLLVKSGFLEADQACSEMLADCKQVARPETERERERETETSCSSSAPKKTRIPPTFAPEEKYVKRAIELGLSLRDITDELASFKEYFNARAGPKGLHCDWQTTFWNWLKRSKKFGQARRNSIAEGFAEINAALDRQLVDEEGQGRDGDSGTVIVELSRLRQSV